MGCGYCHRHALGGGLDWVTCVSSHGRARIDSVFVCIRMKEWGYDPNKYEYVWTSGYGIGSTGYASPDYI